MGGLSKSEEENVQSGFEKVRIKHIELLEHPKSSIGYNISMK